MSGILKQYVLPTAMNAGAGFATGGPVGAAVGAGTGLLGGAMGGGSGGDAPAAGGSASSLGSIANAFRGVLSYLGLGGGPATGSADAPAMTPQLLAQADPTTQGLINQGGIAADPNTGVSSGTGGTIGGTSSNLPLPNLSNVGTAYLRYISGTQAAKIGERTAYATPHSTPVTQMSPQLSLYPNAQFALPQLQLG